MRIETVFINTLNNFKYENTSKKGHAGVMTLKNGTQINYGVIRMTQNMSKIIFYTGMGLRELFKPDMSEEEKKNAEHLKKLNEKTLIKLGYIDEMLISNIQSLS
jgi:hypothetical protein